MRLTFFPDTVPAAEPQRGKGVGLGHDGDADGRLQPVARDGGADRKAALGPARLTGQPRD